tara:strand:+ start:620 stop:1015 length:396 start_codon:yes stop_codon:yes gene_type:complete
MSKDPLFIHLNSMIDNDTRMKLNLLATVRGVRLDALVREQLKRVANEMTVEDLCLEVETAPEPVKRAARKRAPKRKYKKRKNRRHCPVCNELQYGQGMVSHVRSCAQKHGVQYLGWEEKHRLDYQALINKR